MLKTADNTVPSNSYITFAIKYTIVYLSYLYEVNLCFVIFVLIPINGFTVECGRNENQIYLKLFWIQGYAKNPFMQEVTIYATEGITFGKVLDATDRCQQDYY